MEQGRGVVLGGAGGFMAPPDFGRSVNPISTRGTDFALLITTGTPGFSDLLTALTYVINSQKPDIRLSHMKCIYHSMQGS